MYRIALKMAGALIAFGLTAITLWSILLERGLSLFKYYTCFSLQCNT